MHFLDPTNDFIFKRIFGNEKKPAILISFLNSILHCHDDKAIEHITILNPYQAPRIKGSKETILDVRCQDGQGSEYIVEMQVLKEAFFDKRVLLYASRAYANQLGSGEWYDKLVPVTFLGILNFNFTKKKHYTSTHKIHEVETNEHIFRDFQFTLAELPKFKKAENELQTIEDKWLYFLKHAKKLDAVPHNMQGSVIQDAFEIANQANWSREELETYDKHAMFAEQQIQQVRHGEQQGYERGDKAGHKRGRKEGREQRNIEIAKNLLAKGMGSDLIAEITELSIADIEEIKQGNTVCA